MSIEQQQISEFDSIRGRTGSHFKLAKLVEKIGLTVEIDSENNERSVVKLPGVFGPNGEDVVIGEILGDAEAKIV